MFTQGIKLYESEKHVYVLELWGASTKHPDSIFYFDNFFHLKTPSCNNQVSFPVFGNKEKLSSS